MNKLLRRVYPVVMLAAATLILAGCGGKNAVAPADVEEQAFEDLRTEVREAIDDPVREAEVLTLVDMLSNDLVALRKSVSARNSRVRELNSDYDAQRADFDVLFEQINTEIRSNQQRVTKSHLALLEITTAEEWARFSKARTKAMKSAISTIKTD